MIKWRQWKKATDAIKSATQYESIPNKGIGSKCEVRPPGCQAQGRSYFLSFDSMVITTRITVAIKWPNPFSRFSDSYTVIFSPPSICWWYRKWASPLEWAFLIVHESYTINLFVRRYIPKSKQSIIWCESKKIGPIIRACQNNWWLLFHQCRLITVFCFYTLNFSRLRDWPL